MKTSLRKIFPISNVDGKYSNVSIIETKAVKTKVTIKCDMKTTSDNFYCSLKFTIQDNILKVSKKNVKGTRTDSFVGTFFRRRLFWTNPSPGLLFY